MFLLSKYMLESLHEVAHMKAGQLLEGIVVVVGSGLQGAYVGNVMGLSSFLCVVCIVKISII